MDYMELVNVTCPPEIAVEVRAMTGNAASGDTLWDLAPGLEPDCGNNVLGLLADKVDADADDIFLSAYFTAATRMSNTLTTDVRATIGNAASQVNIEDRPDLARTYFTALMVNQIDIREALALRAIGPLWGGDPRSVAWQYHLYLAALDTPDAVKALADHTATIENGNDATNLLRSMATLRKPAIRDVLATYSDDMRHADGPDGPGARISETVTVLIDTYQWTE